MGQRARALLEWMQGPPFFYDAALIREAIERGYVSRKLTAGLTDAELVRLMKRSEADEVDYDYYGGYRSYFDSKMVGSFKYDNLRIPRADSWFIHFTGGRFTTFEHGVNRRYVGQSGNQRTDTAIRCPANLDAGAEKSLWIHAFEVFPNRRGDLHPTIAHSGPAYGQNAVLFQASEVVVGEHYGYDREEQALVLGCSEFNAVMLTDLQPARNGILGRDTIRGIAHLKRGPTQFDSLEDLVTLLEQSNRGSRLAGLPTSRWHPLARAR